VAPGSLAESTLSRYSIRTIGDILVLSDIIEPSAYISLPFVNQAFFVAGCCYIKGRPYPDCMVSGLIPRRYRIATTASNSRSQPPLPPYRVIHNHPSFERTSLRRSRTRETERSLRALLQSVSSSNITTLKQGLATLVVRRGVGRRCSGSKAVGRRCARYRPGQRDGQFAVLGLGARRVLVHFVERWAGYPACLSIRGEAQRGHQWVLYFPRKMAWLADAWI